MLKKFSVHLLILIMLFSATACGNGNSKPAQENPADNAGDSNTPEQIHISFATPGTGTGMYVIGSLMVPLMENALPAGSIIDHTTNSPGGYGACILVEEGGADAALGNGSANKWAYEEGILGHQPIKNVRGIAGGFGNDFINIMFTQTFVDKTGFTTVEDIIGAKYPVRIATKSNGAYGEIACAHVLTALGVGYEDIKSWGGTVYQTDANSIATLLKDDKADITIDHGSSAASAPSELCMTKDMFFPQLSTEVLNTLKAKGWEESNLAANTWKGQAKEVKSVGAPFAVIVRADLGDDIAYAMAKALCEGADTLAAGHAALKIWDPAIAWQPVKLGVPLHPGAERYYKEKGWMK
ncbi:MAG: TAXI family TRAP transporter solute-binding subunit [Peptococcaceae bacterium]